MNTELAPRHPARAGSSALRVSVASLVLAGFSGVVAGQEEFSLEEPAKPTADAAKIAELTEIQSTVEFGIGYVSDDSFRFGRYTGLEDRGIYGILNTDLRQRGPYDSDSAEYFDVSISSLGLDSREILLEFGRQGDFGLHATYDEIPAFRSDSASVIFGGAGTRALILPAAWVPSTNTAGMTSLVSSLDRLPIEVERQRWELGYDKYIGRRWTFSATAGEERREGIKSLGGVIGNSGGNPRAVLLPEPIDYETTTFELVAAFGGDRRQLQLRYQLSFFENDIAALLWENPYSTIGGWDPSAGFPTGEGQMALPPDNRFQQIEASVGLDLSASTRLSADLAMGRMSQDEEFLAYTVNPVLAASVTQPLVEESLEGEIDTTVMNLRLTSHPGRHFHWGASFHYDDRDNQTPRGEYVYIGGDSQTQDTGVASSRRRYNEPYSYSEQRLLIDFGYRMSGGGRLTASADRRETERTFSEREDATEDTLSLSWHQDLSDWFSGTLRLERADRDGSSYHGDEPFLSGYDPGYTSTVPGPWENPPALRKLHLADRERNQIALMATISPSSAWSIGLEADRARDDYENSDLGLTRSDIDAWSVDVSVAPSEKWSAYAFYTSEAFDSGQNGHSIGGGTRVADVANPARAWNAQHRDRVDTAGLGMNWPVIGNRLDAGIEVILAESKSDVRVSTGAALTSAPLPRLKSKLESVGLRAGYRISDDLHLNLRYWYERYRSTDWALDDVDANQLANVILMGDSSPDYRVHVVSLATTLRF